MKQKPPLLRVLSGEFQVGEALDLSGYLGVIERALADLLNTRRGGAGIATDYGLTGNYFAAGKWTAFLSELADDIERTVCRFEPRLTGLSLRVIQSQGLSDRVMFSLSGCLERERETGVQFFATLEDFFHLKLGR